MIPRRFAAVLLACAVTGCGQPEPVWQQRTAASWAAQLWSPASQEVSEAYDALVAFGEKRPQVVLGAIEAAMRRPPPPPVGSPFTVALDLEEARRLGLPERDPAEAVGDVLPVLRARLVTLGFVPASIKANTAGEVDIVAPGGRSRAEVEHAQQILCMRGALDVRAVVRAPGAGGAGPVYDGATPWADFLAAEARRVAAAGGGGAPYRPSDPRWRLVVPATGDPVLVEEPGTQPEAIDERVVAAAEGLLATDGRPAVRVKVRPERVEDLQRFLRRNVGGEMAVLCDGALRARLPVPASDGATLVLTPGDAPAGKDALAWAKDHALLWASGRTPRPLKPVPLAAEFLADPRPDNPFAKVALALGDQAKPMLERLKADGPRWAQASATWALGQLAGE